MLANVLLAMTAHLNQALLLCCAFLFMCDKTLQTDSNGIDNLRLKKWKKTNRNVGFKIKSYYFTTTFTFKLLPMSPMQQCMIGDNTTASESVHGRKFRI